MSCSSSSSRVREPTRGAGVLVSMAALILATGGYAAADTGPLPMMDPDQVVACHTDADGDRWRVQCDDQSKVCLYAPDAVLDADGDQSRALERARWCEDGQEPFTLERWESQGYTMKRGLADAPHGWVRDERGRVMQVYFDLHRRMYLGGGWAPTGQGLGELRESGRAAIDVGFLSVDKHHGRTRHRLRLGHGQIFLAPFAAEMVIFHYDLSNDFRDPALRFTSFFGKPRRHDISMNLGVWMEGGEIEMRTVDGVDDKLWKIGTVHGTVDLWQSRDMYSFVRVRGGAGFESATTGDERRRGVTLGAALEGDITFDRAGFHRLGFELSYENPNYTTVDERVGKRAQRAKGYLEYEMILLALNDQPISLHLGAGVDKRDDSPLLPTRWTARADAGLRFNLWAPAPSR